MNCHGSNRTGQTDFGCHVPCLRTALMFLACACARCCLH
jgi:hypothetical protein